MLRPEARPTAEISVPRAGKAEPSLAGDSPWFFTEDPAVLSSLQGAGVSHCALVSLFPSAGGDARAGGTRAASLEDGCELPGSGACPRGPPVGSLCTSLCMNSSQRHKGTSALIPGSSSPGWVQVKPGSLGSPIWGPHSPEAPETQAWMESLQPPDFSCALSLPCCHSLLLRCFPARPPVLHHQGTGVS